jgi:hypothetical protein
MGINLSTLLILLIISVYLMALFLNASIKNSLAAFNIIGKEELGVFITLYAHLIGNDSLIFSS